MYTAMLAVHSWVRWAVVIAGVVAVVRAIAGASGRRPWTPADDKAGLWFTITLDAQILIGLFLYFVLSPFTTDALRDFGAAMRTPALRFWAVEHVFGVLVGVILAHIGRVRIRRAASSRRHTIALIFFGIALLAVLVSIPWPGTPNGRPWLRW
jgi:cell division protein FtsW (lipid II flippase)